MHSLALITQQLLICLDELQVRGGGGIVVALQLLVEVICQCAHCLVEHHAHVFHSCTGLWAVHLNIIEESVYGGEQMWQCD